MKDFINKIFDGEFLFAVGVIAVALTLITKAATEEMREKHEPEMGQQRLEQLKLEALEGCGKLWE